MKHTSYIIEVDDLNKNLAIRGYRFKARFNDRRFLKDSFISPSPYESAACFQVISEEIVEDGYTVRELEWVSAVGKKVFPGECAYYIEKLGWLEPGTYYYSSDFIDFRDFIPDTPPAKTIVSKQEIEIEGKKFILNITLDPV